MLLPTSGRWNFHLKHDIHKDKYFDKTISKKGRAKFDAALDHLSIMAKDKWQRPHASPVNNSKYVIRFTDENRKQHRLFGHFYDKHSAFVITLTGYEKDNVYYPKDYVRIMDAC